MKKHPSDEKAERELMQLYASREDLVKNLKFAPLDRISEGQALLRRIDAEIEMREALDADVQQSVEQLDKALQDRREKYIDMLRTLDLMEKEPTAPQAALDMIPTIRADTLALLKQDAEERGIPNDDHGSDR